MGRRSGLERQTREVEVRLELDIDGKGEVKVETPFSFLNHMLETLAFHAGFDLKLEAEGRDDHHLLEEVATCLGKALDEALGERRVERFGHAIVPMDDSVATVAVDLGGRGYAVVQLKFSQPEGKLGDVSKQNLPHFLTSFALAGRFNLFARVDGENDHHKVECCFKALARALRDATRPTGLIPSTKGVL